MGAKQAVAADILAAAGIETLTQVDELWLCDAGPVGEFWRAMAEGEGPEIADAAWRWRDRDPVELWRTLAAHPPYPDRPERVAQFLWLQARSASCTPIWWEGGKPVSGGRNYNPANGNWTGADTKAACQTGGRWVIPDGHAERVGDAVGRTANSAATTLRDVRQKGRDSGSREAKATATGTGGLRSSGTIAQRVRALNDALRRVRLVVIHGDIAECAARLPEDLRDTVVYHDPPYVRATRYAVQFGRDRVIDFSAEMHRRGALHLISEGEPVEVPGFDWRVDLSPARKRRKWTARQRGEWLTMNRAPGAVPPRQVALFASGVT